MGEMFRERGGGVRERARRQQLFAPTQFAGLRRTLARRADFAPRRESRKTGSVITYAASVTPQGTMRM